MIAVRPTDVHASHDYERRLAEVSVGSPQRLSGMIELAAYDPAWTAAYRSHAAKIGAALGDRALRLEHVGSTSVPQLPAKPVIDIVLEVRDSAAEPAYAPNLQAAGYELRIREPDWFEHRLFKDLAGGVNLHVFSGGCPETERIIQFRDWLRSHPQRPRPLRPHQVRTRRPSMDLHAAIRRRQDQRDHVSHGPGPRRPADPRRESAQSRHVRWVTRAKHSARTRICDQQTDRRHSPHPRVRGWAGVAAIGPALIPVWTAEAASSVLRR